MTNFVDLGISVFDPEFTLNPYKYLKPFYGNDDIIGFESHGMKFLFKFKHCREAMFSKNFARPTGDADFNAREIEYAKKYPTRAHYFSLDYSHGEPDMKLKSIMVRLIGEITERASLEMMEPIAKKLTRKGRLENYIPEVSYLPMRLYLDVCGLEYTQEELKELHRKGCDFLKSFENQGEEELIALSDQSIQYYNAFIQKSFEKLKEGDLLLKYLEEGRAAKIDEDKLRANIGNVILVSLSNTFGVSSAFVLRNLIRDPELVKQLKSKPDLLERDDTITEILRRDNHVKALSRAAIQDTDIGGYTFKKGEAFFIYFPGLNMDPSQWADPERIDLNRAFDNTTNLVFGGSVHMCIGKKLTFAAMKSLLKAFIKHLPETAEVIENEIEMDGSWLAERIITKMPIMIK